MSTQNKNLIAREIYEKSVFVKSHGEIDTFIEALEWSLLYLQAPAKEIIYEKDREQAVKLHTFDGAILMSGPGLDSRADDFSFFDPIKEREVSDFRLMGDLNIKTLILPDDADSAISLQKWRKIENVKNRQINIFSKNRRIPLVEYSLAAMMSNETWFTARNHYAVFNDPVYGRGSILHPVLNEKDYIYSKESVRKYAKTDAYIETIKNFWWAMSINLSSYYEWWAYFRDGKNGIGIKIPIFPETLKDIDRGIKPEFGRKKAFLHFVKSHYRSIPGKYDETYRQTLVKQHMRGRTKIDYRGLELHIIPSKHDIDKMKPGKKFLQFS